MGFHVIKKAQTIRAHDTLAAGALPEFPASAACQPDLCHVGTSEHPASLAVRQSPRYEQPMTVLLRLAVL